VPVFQGSSTQAHFAVSPTAQITKAMQVSLTWRAGFIPVLKFEDRLSYATSKTKQYDAEVRKSAHFTNSTPDTIPFKYSFKYTLEDIKRVKGYLHEVLSLYIYRFMNSSMFLYCIFPTNNCAQNHYLSELNTDKPDTTVRHSHSSLGCFRICSAPAASHNPLSRAFHSPVFFIHPC
jgi:hypothetical protein